MNVASSPHPIPLHEIFPSDPRSLQAFIDSLPVGQKAANTLNGLMLDFMQDCMGRAPEGLILIILRINSRKIFQLLFEKITIADSSQIYLREFFCTQPQVHCSQNPDWTNHLPYQRTGARLFRNRSVAEAFIRQTPHDAWTRLPRNPNFHEDQAKEAVAQFLRRFVTRSTHSPSNS